MQKEAKTKKCETCVWMVRCADTIGYCPFRRCKKAEYDRIREGMNKRGRSKDY